MYARIARGKTRSAALQELRRLHLKTGEPQTIGKLRRELTTRYPITLNAMIRAINELQAMGAITCTGQTKKAKLRLFTVTEVGDRIGEVLDM
jgi:hypothetical protein